MENKLEQLLRNIILAGWKPFGEGTAYDKKHGFFHPGCGWVYRTLREITSKESGLWQFVCENGMVDKQHGYIEELKWWKADDDEEGHDNGEERYSTEYQFWLIETSLKNEDELEDFLLSNIKIKG